MSAGLSDSWVTPKRFNSTYWIMFCAMTDMIPQCNVTSHLRYISHFWIKGLPKQMQQMSTILILFGQLANGHWLWTDWSIAASLCALFYNDVDADVFIWENLGLKFTAKNCWSVNWCTLWCFSCICASVKNVLYCLPLAAGQNFVFRLRYWSIAFVCLFVWLVNFETTVDSVLIIDL